MSLTRVVAITGCDSGLGWALAARLAREGLVTVAGMYQGVDTEAAKALEKLCVHPYPLDVKNNKSISNFKDYIDKLLERNPNYTLHAIVNNAGVMTIGDYEWQTLDMIENAIQINLLGPMKMVSAFLPNIRRTALQNMTNTTRPRIINIASHCGLQPLPCFAAYSASKAGLIAWTKALRLELRPHGISAVAFIPGGFVGASKIMCNQTAHGKNMLEHLDEEQKEFYETKLLALNDYLGSAPCNAKFNSLNDLNIIETFMAAVTDKRPNKMYKVESWRYMFYYNLFKLPVPEALHHWLIKKFINFPQL